MKLTREEALELHRQMWGDMQKDLGDCPDYVDRLSYKSEWCNKRFPTEEISAFCFLCEYAGNDCNHCPIDWGAEDCFSGEVTYRYSLISEILALPERIECLTLNGSKKRDT